MRQASVGMAIGLGLLLAAACAAQNTGAAAGNNESGKLGINIMPLNAIPWKRLPKEQAKQFKDELAKAGLTEKSAGWMIASILPKSPAEKAGLRVGDIIIGVGKKVYKDDMEGLQAAWGKMKPGKATKITVVRGGNEEVVTVTPVSVEEITKLNAQAGAAAKAAAGPGPVTIQTGFEDVEPGALPEGWKARRTGAGTTAPWKVVDLDDGSGGAKNKKVLTLEPAGNEAETMSLLMFEQGKYGPTVVSVRMKFVGGSNAKGGGVAWRAKNSKNYFGVVFDAMANEARMFKVVDGAVSVLQANKFDKKDIDLSKADEWFRVDCEHTNARLIIRLNGKNKVIDLRDATYKDGKIGLLVPGDAETQFDELLVDQLQSPNSGT